MGKKTKNENTTRQKSRRDGRQRMREGKKKKMTIAGCTGTERNINCHSRRDESKQSVLLCVYYCFHFKEQSISVNVKQQRLMR